MTSRDVSERVADRIGCRIGLHPSLLWPPEWLRIEPTRRARSADVSRESARQLARCGYADFVGDVRAAIHAVDAVLLVVSAVDGVEVQTEVAWERRLWDRMRYRRLGPRGPEVSVISVGTSPLGGSLWEPIDADAVTATIRAAIDAGVNLIDTTDAYGSGRAECPESSFLDTSGAE